MGVFLLVVVAALPGPSSAQYSVTTTAGDTSSNSLGAALSSSSGDGAGTSDTISFGSLFNTTQTITVSGSYPAIVKNAGVNLTIGPPAANLTLTGGTSPLLD